MFTTIREKKIKFLYKYLVKPVLFKFDPEMIHDRFITAGSILGRFKITKTIVRLAFNYQNPQLAQKIAGLNFRNPVGLSAGFDKDAKAMSIMEDVGFGYVQIGTVTDQPYEGNPKPRLHRLKKSGGIVVYYGLKNIGIDSIIPKLKAFKANKILQGISIGKTNCELTAKEQAGIDDYYSCTQKIQAAGVGDFYTINISCPNTFGGEPFTTAESLARLLEKLQSFELKKPIFLKMPINSSWKDFQKLIDVAVANKITGVIIGNLNKNHQDETIQDKIPVGMQGGVSGRPTSRHALKLISKTYKKYGDRLIIIGAGGVFSAEDAYEMMRRGASLVQLITGMIFEGPQLIGEINHGLVKLMKRDGFKHISEVIGSKYK